MIYERDWLMRQIRALAAFLWLLISGKQVQEEELTAALSEATASDELRRRLAGMLREGQICQAEDALFEAAQAGEAEALRAAVWFYLELNRLSDETLERHNFSREEIFDGLRDICALYDIPADMA